MLEPTSFDLTDSEEKLSGWRLMLVWALMIGGPWALIGWAAWWLFQ